MPSSVFLLAIGQQFYNKHSYLAEQSSELAKAYSNKVSVVQEEILRNVGASLWQALDCETEFLKQRKASGQDVLNIIIESDDSKILNLAWETLYHPELGFLGRLDSFTLSRRLPMQPAPKLPIVECTPLRILLFAAMPMDLGEHGRLKIEEEKANVLQAITPLEDQGLVKLITPNDGRFESLKHALADYQPHLVYLSGHGSLDHNTLDNTYQGKLLFEDNYANSLEISEDELAECFNSTSVQAVVLSACESGKFDARELNNGLSIRLSQMGIPHVIGMRESILDNAGLEFAVTFLKRIALKQSVATALQAARQAIKTHLVGYVARDQQSTPILRAITKQQWCLPSLISHDISQPLVDWSFVPQPREFSINLDDSLNSIFLPEQFFGRKRELYKLFQPLVNGSQKKLLLTAAGGMGKTALAGKLCQQLKQTGFEIFAYSTQEGNQWSGFVSSLECALKPRYAKQYDADKTQLTNLQRSQKLLKLLLDQYQGKVVLFLDNLESIQDPNSRKLIDDEVQSWLIAIQSLLDDGLRIILTSRWCLPDWEGDMHHFLEKPVYSDFIAFARQKGLLSSLYSLGKSREVYDVLGGNFRAFEFFVNASKELSLEQTDDFLTALEQAKGEIQVDMSLTKVLDQRTTAENSLLTQLLAYPIPVPISGIQTITEHVKPIILDGDEPVKAINTLSNLSLVERIYNHKFKEIEYQVSALLRDYLGRQGCNPSMNTRKVSALYLYNILLEERGSLDLAILAHKELIAVNEIDAAQQLLLNTITPALYLKGLYHCLLDDYLIPSLNHTHPDKVLAKTQGQIGNQYIKVGSYETADSFLNDSLKLHRKTGDKLSEGAILNDMSQSYDARAKYDTALKYLHHSLTIVREVGNQIGEGMTLNNIAAIDYKRGEYETALKHLNESLSIQQKIKDKSGEGSTLNNISQIFTARGKYDTALEYLYKSLAIRRRIGDKSGEGATLNNISRVFKAQGDHESALKYLNLSLKIYQKIGDKLNEGAALNNLSQILKAQKDYSTALKLLKQCLEIQQDIGDKSGEGAALNNMATITHLMGDSDSALDFLNKTLVINREIGNQLGEGAILNNISQILRAKGDDDAALNYLKQSLVIRKRIGHKPGESATLNNIAHIYWSGGDYKIALDYFHQSLAIKREIDDKSGAEKILGKISQVLKEKEDYQSTLK